MGRAWAVDVAAEAERGGRHVARWALTIVLTLAPVVTGGADAHAQATISEADRASAREAFVEGTRAIEEGRWADAAASFDRAYELTGSPVARFNHGYALRAMGRFREARDAFDEVLRGEVDEETRAEARALRDEVAARLATLHLEGEPIDGLRLRLDAEPIEGTLPLTLSVDPGPHVLTGRAAERTPWDWSGELSSGTSTSLRIELPPLPSAPAPAGPGIVAEPWLWIVLGAVVLGGAAVAAWAIDEEQQLRPESPVLRP